MITNDHIFHHFQNICKNMQSKYQAIIVENPSKHVPKYLEMGIRFNIHTGCIETNLQILNLRFDKPNDNKLIIAIAQEIRQSEQYNYLWDKIGRDGTKVLCMNPDFRHYLFSDAGISAVNVMLQITSGKPAEIKPLEILLSNEEIIKGFKGLHFTNNNRRK